MKCVVPCQTPETSDGGEHPERPWTLVFVHLCVHLPMESPWFLDTVGNSGGPVSQLFAPVPSGHLVRSSGCGFERPQILFTNALPIFPSFPLTVFFFLLKAAVVSLGQS